MKFVPKTAIILVLVWPTWLFTACVGQQSDVLTNQKPNANNKKSEFVNSIGMKFIRISAGKFIMGSPESAPGREDDEMEHDVQISRPLYFGVYEVTQREYRAVLGKSPSYFSQTGDGSKSVMGIKTADFPVENITWVEAVKFCNALSVKEGRQPVYKVLNLKAGRTNTGFPTEEAVVEIEILNNGYRLPTEAEWEYACRAGTKSLFSFGDELSDKQANIKPDNYDDRRGPPRRTAKVGSYPPNRFGLYDMHGNVSEWCQDLYSKDYYETSPKTDPMGAKSGEYSVGDYRLARGGSTYGYAIGCRSAYREHLEPQYRYSTTGFRVVLPIPKEAENAK